MNEPIIAMPDATRGGSSGRRRPFLCEASAVLPAGWVRGDPLTTEVDRPRLQVAYDPSRHTVACLPIAASRETERWLAAAGFERLEADDPSRPGMQIYVRDRRACPSTPVRPALRAR